VSEQSEFKKRLVKIFDDYETDDDQCCAVSFLIDEAKKEIYEAIGSFNYKEPYNYNLPQLKIRYEEASHKLLATINKIQKWFGVGGVQEVKQQK